MNNIYSLCASQEAQPLQKTTWITYNFVQIHKLDKAASPTTYKKSPVAWWVVDSLIDTFMAVFSFRAKVRLSDWENKIMIFRGDGRKSFASVRFMYVSLSHDEGVSGAFQTGLFVHLSVFLLFFLLLR